MNKIDHHSVILAVITTAVAVGLAASLACLAMVYQYKQDLITYQTNVNAQLEALKADDEAIMVDDTEDAMEDDALVYTNSDYNYSITFSSDWSDYTTTDRTLDWTVLTSESVDFGMPNYDSIFNITVMTPAEWEELEDANDGPLPTVIEETEDYVYLYSTAQDIPTEYQDLLMQVTDIVDTFEVNN